MITVGLTGSIASGKSLLASYLAQKGARVLDADRIGHEVMRKAGPAYAEVVAAFGPAILDDAGEVDRGRLGSLVFADPAARRRLEGIVHPLLIEELRRRLSAARSEGAQVVVVDAALIHELGLAGDFDLLVAVSAQESVQLERLRGRGLSERESLQRIAAQWPGREKERRSDLVVANDGTQEEFAEAADRLWNAIQERARLKDPGGPDRKDRSS